MEATHSIFARAGLLYVVAAMALAMGACTRSGGRTASYGTLTGRITRGPMSPVSGPGVSVPPAPPVAGVELKIFNKGAVVATTRTDSAGLYRLTLPPGNYRVERGAGFSGAARNLPATVAISPRGQTRLDILVDTGIRAPVRPAAR